MSTSKPLSPSSPAPAGKPSPGGSSTKLKAERVELMLAALPGWKLTYDQKGLTRTFQFSSSERAFAFANLVAGMAFRRNQYPEVRFWRDTVTLSLTTPKVGGLTVMDFALARQINQQV